jgi:glycerate-2-kinase
MLTGAQLLLIQRWRDEIARDRQAIAEHYAALEQTQDERLRQHYITFIANHRQHQRDMESLIRAHGVEV